ATIVGASDPAAPCQPVQVPTSGCAPAMMLVSVPWHTLDRRADEILCGRQDIDWLDFAPMDGDPDTCPNGIFDNGIGASHAISIEWFDDDPTSPTGNQYVARAVRKSSLPPNPFLFTGMRFDLGLTDAYLVVVGPAHSGTSYCAP